MAHKRSLAKRSASVPKGGIDLDDVSAVLVIGHAKKFGTGKSKLVVEKIFDQIHAGPAKEAARVILNGGSTNDPDAKRLIAEVRASTKKR
jgi:hypothetical protein